MTYITQILNEASGGDSRAAERLLPLVYNELRQLAAAKLSKEPPGHTLQPTALVHEAYLRLVDKGETQTWNSRGHFFSAAAEAMRRILIESARRRKTLRAGGDMARQQLSSLEVAAEEADERLLALDEALDELRSKQPVIGRLVELRYFAGLTIEQAAEALEISKRSANRYWKYAKAWLTIKLQ